MKKALFAELDQRRQGRRHPRHQHLDPARSSRWPWRPSGPSGCVGVHFFNPAPMMSLVEVIRPLTASGRHDRRGHRRSPTACGKDPVEVKDRAGFIVNALLFPYLNNAVRMLENRHGRAVTTSTPP